MDTNPICPYCLVDIEYDDMIDNNYDGSHHDSKWIGHAPFATKSLSGTKFICLIVLKNLRRKLTMAKFNDKVLCLFNKDYKQLKKEMNRRGMVYETREKAIAKSIWKDAYDAGFTEGKNFASALSNAARNCHANCCGNTKPEVKEYCLYDIDEAIKYRLELTEEQVSAIEWMIDHNFMTDVEFSEWCDSFEDVGRI